MSTKTLIVKSAYPLSKIELNSIVEGMGIKTQTDLELKNEVDKSLVAGVIIKYNGYYLDLSLRHKLREIVASLS